MRVVTPASIRRICGLLLLSAFAAIPAHGQESRLQITNLDKLTAKASEVVDVNIEGAVLQLAINLLSSKKPNEAKIKEIIQGLKGVYVKSFEFEQAGQYSEADVEPIRSQLRGPGWSRIVGVISKKGSENVEVYTKTEGTSLVALAIIAAEPKELTIVNIVGPIDLDKLRELEGNFGIPHLDFEKKKKNPEEE